MTALRRAVAVSLVLPLIACFVLALVAGRLNSTLLNPEFVKQQARDLRLYERLHDDGTHHLVRQLLDEPGKRPANLRAIDLPTDRKAEDGFARLIQSFLPASFIQVETEEAIDEVLPWLAGKDDHFTLHLSLHEGLTRTFGHPTPGQASTFERTWRDLGMGERTVVSLAQSYDRNPDNAGKPVPGAPTGARGVASVIEANRQAAGIWFDQQWFGVIDQAVPYLAGDAKSMDARISFATFPMLAGPFSSVLHVPPEQLAAQGWRLTDADLKKQLGNASNPTLSRSDNTIALFTRQGGTLTDGDLIARYDRQRAKGAADGKPVEGPSITEVRSIFNRVRLAGLYGAPFVCLLLVMAIAFLGGRTWPSRLAWGSAGLLVAAAIALGGTTAIYRLAASGPLDRWVDEERTRPASGFISADLRVNLAEQVRKVAGEQADRASLNASAWLIVAMGGLAGGLTWERVANRRHTRGGATA